MNRKIPAAIIALVGVACAAAAPTIARSIRAASSTSGKTTGAPEPLSAPALAHTCLITNDVKSLTAFYERALLDSPVKSADDYVEFRTSGAVLAIFSAAAQEQYIPGAAVPGENRSAILEFRVDDVDREYARLKSLVRVWVKGPTTQPWGTRSIYFRDPDGNLVDFFAPAKTE